MLALNSEKPKSVSLVLGSGGARGLAHIGVIHELERRGLEIASISGCSIGALIGGVYAAGKLDEFETWVRAITKMDMVNLLDLSWALHGLVKGDKIIGTLVGRFIRDLQSSDENDKADTLGAYDVADQAFDAMQSTIARQKLAAYPPDMVIEIPRNACGTNYRTWTDQSQGVSGSRPAVINLELSPDRHKAHETCPESLAPGGLRLFPVDDLFAIFELTPPQLAIFIKKHFEGLGTEIGIDCIA